MTLLNHTFLGDNLLIYICGKWGNKKDLNYNIGRSILYASKL